MYFKELSKIPEKEIFKGGKGQFIHTATMTIAYWKFEAGAGVAEHSHPHEQISSVIKGQFEMTIGGETQILEAGKVGVIPSNVKHSGRALTDCEIIDTFSPLREDYL